MRKCNYWGANEISLPLGQWVTMWWLCSWTPLQTKRIKCHWSARIWLVDKQWGFHIWIRYTTTKCVHTKYASNCAVHAKKYKSVRIIRDKSIIRICLAAQTQKNALRVFHWNNISRFAKLPARRSPMRYDRPWWSGYGLCSLDGLAKNLVQIKCWSLLHAPKRTTTPDWRVYCCGCVCVLPIPRSCLDVISAKAKLRLMFGYIYCCCYVK